MHIVYSASHEKHHPILEFYEGELKHYHDAPERAQMILDAVHAARIGPVVGPSDFGLGPILAVHTVDYVAYLQDAYRNWIATGGIPAGVYPDSFPARRMSRRPTRPSALAGYYSFDITAVIVEGTWEAAYQSAQCALTAASQVASGDRAAFALCRPPGHHAHADLSGGYCFLNNAAIAADWLARSPDACAASDSSARRVALLDIDFHHGNGTQDIFYDRADVLYLSIHGDPDRQYPYYLGGADENGTGAGAGYTLNFPLEAGVGDLRYMAVLEKARGRVREYMPVYLVVSLGVDTFAGDPLGDFELTEDVYARIGSSIAQLNLPTVFIMEGGYAISQLGKNVAAVLTGFNGTNGLLGQ
jgi:acetoin utilization deacetylase AcuC-like enzyme